MDELEYRLYEQSVSEQGEQVYNLGLTQDEADELLERLEALFDGGADLVRVAA